MSNDKATIITAAAASRLLEKLSEFASTLDPTEQAALAALMAPGVTSAYGEQDVAGFGVVWSDRSLPEHLAKAIRHKDLRVHGW